jgi:hypothetical protein
MKRSFIAAAVSLGALAYGLPAGADDRLVRFDGGIGSQPLRSGGAVNVVRGVNPGGIPWVIADLRADIRSDGTVRVDGRGLLLAGGDNVGRPGNNMVRASLFCGPVATQTRHDSGQVQLQPDGDFKIDDVMTPSVPRDCPDAVLLIVNQGGAWFAAGIPKL